jgi:hypothetical protein
MRLQAFRWAVLAAVACAGVIPAGWLPRPRQRFQGEPVHLSIRHNRDQSGDQEFGVHSACTKRRIAVLAGLSVAVTGPI